MSVAAVASLTPSCLFHCIPTTATTDCIVLLLRVRVKVGDRVKVRDKVRVRVRASLRIRVEKFCGVSAKLVILRNAKFRIV